MYIFIKVIVMFSSSQKQYQVCVVRLSQKLCQLRDFIGMILTFALYKARPMLHFNCLVPPGTGCMTKACIYSSLSKLSYIHVLSTLNLDYPLS